MIDMRCARNFPRVKQVRVGLPGIRLASSDIEFCRNLPDWHIEIGTDLLVQ
jgi:hypothetical protein